MAANQATINVAVSVKQISDITGLRDAFASLRDVIIRMQRAREQVAASGRKDAESAARVARTVAATQVQEARKVAVAEKGIADVQHRNAQTTLADSRRVAVEITSQSRVRVDASRIERNNTLNQIGLSREKRQIENQAARELARQKSAQEREEKTLIRLQQRANELNAKHQAQLQDEKQKQAALKATIKDRLAYYERALDAIFRAGYRLKQVGQDLKRFGTSIINELKGFTDVFGEFEFMAGRAAGAIGGWAISGQEADKNFRALQDTILANAESLRLFTATDVAKSLYFLASTTGQVVDSQKDLNNMMSALEPIMQTAALTQTDYETTIKGVYSIVAQYNSELLRFSQNSGDYTLMSEEMRKVTIDLFYVAQKTAAEFNDLVNSFKMVGPVAKQSGASFEDILDLLGRLADIGIRGTMAGRALRQMFIQMVKPSGPATEALNELFNSEKNLVEFGGKNYKQLMFPDGQFVGTTKYINILARALQGATQQQRNYLLAKISTANMLPVMQALISEETAIIENGGQALSKTADMNTKAQETFSAAWERLRTSWVGTTSALQRGIESLQIVIGRELADAFTPFIEKVRQIVDALRAWVQANPQLVSEIGKFIGVAAGISVVAGTILSATGGIIGMVAAASLIVGAFGPAIPVIGSLIALVIAFGAAMIDRFNEIQRSLQSFASEISRFFSSLVSNSEDGVSAIQSIIDMFKLVANQFINVGKTIIDTLTAIVKMINDLGLAIPIVKTLGIVLAYVFGKSILNGIKNLILSTRLFRTETTMTWKAVTTESNGVTVSLLSQEIATKRVGLGYRVLTGIQETWAASSLRAALASTSFGVAASAAITTIGTTLRTVVSLAFGPVGIIAMFAGMAAYESNFLGLKDVISGVAGSTRDLNKELADTASSLGDISIQTRKIIEKTSVPNLQDVISQVSNIVPQVQDSVAGRASGERMLQMTAWGKTFTQNISKNWLNQEELDKAQTDLIKQLQDWHDSTIANTEQWIIETRDGLNASLIALGKSPIDATTLVSGVIDLSAKLNIDPSKLLSTFKFGLENSLSYSEFYTIAEQTYGKTVGPAVTDAYFNSNLIRDSISKGFANRKLEAQKKLYQPVVNELISAMQSGDQSRVVKALSEPIGYWVSGTFVATGDALAAMSPELRDELGVTETVNNALIGLDSNVAAGLDQTLFEGDEETAQTISDLVTAKLQSDFDMAHRNIVDSATASITAFVNDTSASIFSPAKLETLAGAGIGSERAATYQRLANTIINPRTGETILDYVKSDKSLENELGTTLGPLYKSAIEQGIEQGWIDASLTVKPKIPDVAKNKLGQLMGSGRGLTRVFDASEISKTVSSSIDKSIRILNPEINSFSEGILQQFSDSISKARTDAEIHDAYTMLFNNLYDGQSIAQLASSESVTPELRDIFKSIIQNAVSLGFVDKSVLDTINGAATEDAKKTWSEYVDAFTSAVESAGSFKERLKEALKAGSTGKQVGQLLRTFVSKDIRKALRGNLGSRALGIEQLGLSAEGLIGGLTALKPAQRKKFAARIVKFLSVNKENLPPDAKNALAPVIQYMIDNSMITPAQQTKLDGIFGDILATDTPISEEQANSTGVKIMTEAATGIANASTNKEVLTIVTTASINMLDAFTSGVDWKTAGFNAGKAWADGLADGMQAFIVSLNVIKDNTEGHSPPKKGPLKNIDKGGRAVGMAYGKAMSHGMITSFRTGMSAMKSHANHTPAAMSMSWQHDSKKTINLNVNIASDGKTSPSVLSEVRKGIRDALAASDLEHMIGVS